MAVDSADTGPDLLDAVAALARRAGDAIMPFYRGEGLRVETKSDDSPVTGADRAAHAVIERGLRDLDRRVPLLSEEGELPPWRTRRYWRRYWLVDPLDGTREFVGGSAEFTVNIALVENGVAVLGVVLLPVTGQLYAGLSLRAGAPRLAFREDAAGRRATLRTRPVPVGRGAEPLVIAVSRTYGEDDMASLRPALARQFGAFRLVPAGSSLKFCRIAAGEADFYPRRAPTSEWDTAAGQAVVEAAGGGVWTLDGGPLRYNRKNSCLNPGFYAVGDTRPDWRNLLALGR